MYCKISILLNGQNDKLLFDANKFTDFILDMLLNLQRKGHNRPSFQKDTITNLSGLDAIYSSICILLSVFSLGLLSIGPSGNVLEFSFS